jgi:hypothetical protein
MHTARGMTKNSGVSKILLSSKYYKNGTKIMIKWLFTFGVWVRMKSMFKSVEIHKRHHISRKITRLQQKLKAKHDPNSKFVFSCSHAYVVSVSQIRQVAVICYLLSFTNNAVLYHLWFGNSEFSKCVKKKKGQKWVQRMVENFKGNA